MRVDATPVRAGVPDRSARLVARWILVSLALLAVLTALIGLAFAGSPARIAEGVQIAGVDVGGLTQEEARTLLESRFERVARVPVVFTAGGEEYPIKATTLGVEADWAAAVDSAAREGEGFGPVRGFKRLQTRFFGAEIAPPVQVYEAALDFKLAALARAIDQSHVEAKLVRRGLGVEVVPGQSGRRLAQDLAAARIVRALARLERGQPIALPVRLDPVEVTAADLAPGGRQARTALSAPVRLEYEGTRWKLPRWRIAELLSLPVAGRHRRRDRRPGRRGLVREAAQDGRAAARRRDVPAGRRRRRGRARQGRPCRRRAGDREGAARGRGLAERADRDAGRPHRPGRAHDGRGAGDGDRAAARLLHDALRGHARPDHEPPARRLAAQRRAWSRPAPRSRSTTASASARSSAASGRRPVIIKDEYEEDVGGGVSQVATTVFNAAWEAGLKIAERNPHSLYISRYQLGRDATVNYPDLDLKFVNDTPKWVYVAGASGGSGITVSIYGGGPERRVESGTGTIRETGPAPIRRVKDPTLLEGRDGDRGGGLAGARDLGHPDRLRRGGRGHPRRDLEHLLPRRVPGDPRRHEAAAEARAEGEAQGREAGPPTPTTETVPARRRLSPSDRLEEPRREAASAGA